MSPQSPEKRADGEARDGRRWLIGIAITVLFGVFGMVMALLSYSDRQKPRAPGVAPATSAARESPDRPTRKDERRKDRNKE